MGLLLKLITFPVSGPVGGTLWIAEQVLAAAEREYYDESAIVEQLAELDERVATGELSEEDYDAEADELLERLREAHAFWADQEVEPVDEERADA